MTVRELYKEQKIALINDILENWKICDAEYYICSNVSRQALHKCWISYFEYNRYYMTDIALQLIPELLLIKPDNTGISKSWFGEPEQFGGIRTQKLLELKEIIKK
jgi:hypothetical protein